jgi:rhodanese-related sulfurtransferase
MPGSHTYEALPEISAAEAHQRVQHEGALLLDVREAFELDQVRVPGAAHMPLGELATRQAELDRDRPVAVICRSGNRSAMAVAHLRRLGVDAVNVAGGLIGWHDAELPLETGRAGVPSR